MSAIKTTPIKVSGRNIINYSYLVSDKVSQEAVIVDPGWDFEKISRAIDRDELKLIGVLLTHHHRDHVNLAEIISHHYDVPVYMHEEEQSYYDFKCRNLKTFSSLELKIGNIQVESIFTPGHTKGSVCYKIEGDLITGDTLFIEGCGECVCDGASAETLFDSLNVLKNLPDKTRVYPGHRFKRLPGMSMKYLKDNNIYLQTDDRLSFASFRSRAVVSVYR